MAWNLGSDARPWGGLLWVALRGLGTPAGQIYLIVHWYV